MQCWHATGLGVSLQDSPSERIHLTILRKITVNIKNSDAWDNLQKNGILGHR